MIFILIIAFIIICYLAVSLYQTNNTLKFTRDTFQLKVLAKHIALTREIEALTLLRNQTDFKKLDEIINRLKSL